MERGRLVLAQGYGFADLETNTRATADSVFRIGSLTKQFTAAAVLLLAEQGALSVDEPVSKYLPAFPADDPTTIRQLLTHTSGIADYVGRDGFVRETKLPHTTDELVSYVLAKSPLHDFPSGTQWAYSSSNYVLAGAIAERVSGMRLAAFLKARIFEPLGMFNTALDDARDVVANRASGYDRIAVETVGYANARQIDMSVPFAAGAMRSTVRDLAVWSDAVTHGKVLKDASFRIMIEPARLTDGTLPTRLRPDGSRGTIRYGMGVGVGDSGLAPVLAADGAIDGFTSVMKAYAGTDVVLVALVNTSPSAHLPFAKIMAAVDVDPAVGPKK